MKRNAAVRPSPAISVVIPSFNQAEYLEAAISSVVDQGYEALEVIVMDGGSTDGSCRVIEAFSSSLAYWQSRPDGGQAAAIAAGFELATGELLTWLNSDDILLPGALHSNGRAYCGRPDADVFYGDHVVIDAGGAVVERYKHPPYFNWLAWLTGPYIAQPGTLFTRRIWEETGGVDRDMHCAFDYDLWYRFMDSRATFVHVGSFVSGFRIHARAKGAAQLARYAAEDAILRQRYSARLGSWSERKMARLLLGAMQILSGAYLHTICYRLSTQGRLRAFGHSRLR
jgi:glycosyltransferase involved in cell wall biosynthesis